MTHGFFPCPCQDGDAVADDFVFGMKFNAGIIKLKDRFKSREGIYSLVDDLFNINYPGGSFFPRDLERLLNK